MSLINVSQQSVEWLKFREGRCTGSRVKDALSFLKNGQPSQKRKDYLSELVTERLSGRAVDHYITPAMEHGTDTEPHARAAYEAITGYDVIEVGIATHPTIKDFCTSPDGFIGGDGCLEIKAPTTMTHLEWIFADIIPSEHEFQMMAHMACSGRQFCDFFSFDDRLPPRHQYFLKRLERKDVEDKIAAMEAGVVQFLSELDSMMEKLEAR